MNYKLDFDSSKTVLCPETFSPFEVSEIKLSIPIEANNNCRLSSEFIKEAEDNLYNKVMLDLGVLIKKHIENIHPYGKIKTYVKINKKSTLFEKLKRMINGRFKR